jgi:hypothetical protein
MRARVVRADDSLSAGAALPGFSFFTRLSLSNRMALAKTMKDDAPLAMNEKCFRCPLFVVVGQLSVVGCP